MTADHRDALRGGEQVILPDHAKGGAEPRSFEQKESEQRRAEQSVDDQHELRRADVVLEDVADIAETLDAVWSDRFTVAYDLIAEQFEQNPHGLRERQRGDGKLQPVQPQRRQPDQQGGGRTRRGARAEPERERQLPHRRDDAGGVGADGEEGLLAEGDFPGQQQQIGRQRDKGDHADVGDDADQVVVHRSPPRWPMPWRAAVVPRMPPGRSTSSTNSTA